jgi:hypothetical protein
VTIVAVVGDATTTTCVALAAGWPDDDDVVIVEADRTGGSLAGWLDTPSTPSLASIVANVAASPAEATSTIASMIQRSASGIRFVGGPLRALPARRSVDEAGAVVVPALVRTERFLTLADVGRSPESLDHPFIRAAALTVVVHRQRADSAGADAVRIERLVESIEQLTTAALPVVLAVIGRSPFDPDDIVRHVEAAVPGSVEQPVRLADDPLAASVLAGRGGVSARRLGRLALMRSAGAAAVLLAATVAERQEIPTEHAR